MKKVKGITALFLIMILMLSMCNFYVGATDSDSMYEETRDQINIKYTSLNVDEDELSIQIKDDNFIYRYFGNKEQAKLSEVIEKYPEVEKAIIQTIQTEKEVCAIAYTEAPVYIYKDHMERVRKNRPLLNFADFFLSLFPIANAQSATGPNAYEAEGNFTLFTYVTKESNGTYTVGSMALWDYGSWIGGEKYPASGYDFLLQAVPESFYHLSHNFNSIYTKSGNIQVTPDAYTGREGYEYTITDGGSSYMQVKLKDDPIGLARLSACTFETNSASDNYNGYRKINSYYVHTWKSMDISVSVAGNSGKEVSLSITPSVSEKSWQVYSYVSFNF